ncbi:histidine kinase dimerization/phospho-acceptor domain-containing protein, partial [Parabacteroides goldsteinii]|uniref:histidine kinase dimerization/phospho-acceptor domain-containing protein n=1 Tax=Parabacteroides goldsteinii TaxID=328812 RepID=UPI0025A059F9
MKKTLFLLALACCLPTAGHSQGFMKKLKQKVENAVGISESTGEPESLVTGVLEITQDITDDYDSVVRFQWLILATCLGSSTILFAMLQFFIAKAERTLAERMARNRKLEAELHQNEKLASMGRVIASIAHEIRNPLGIIRSSAELLIR